MVTFLLNLLSIIHTHIHTYIHIHEGVKGHWVHHMTFLIVIFGIINNTILGKSCRIRLACNVKLYKPQHYHDVGLNRFPLCDIILANQEIKHVHNVIMV